MAISLIALATLVFVAVCWLIGARSRLLRLREVVANMARQLGDALQQQADWVSAQSVLATRSDDACWQRANAAAAQLTAALVLVRDGPRSPAWEVASAAHGVQMHALQQIDCFNEVLLEDSNNFGGKEVIPKEKIDFHLHADRVHAAAQAYNEAHAAYNQAIAMFPAHVLACLLRLRPAQPFSEFPSTP